MNEENERPVVGDSKLRTLGASGVEVTPIGLGAWQFSEGKGGARGTWDPLTEQATDQIVAAALQGGINWFDTAELYGFGRSERGLSRALVRAGVQNGEVVVANKWCPLFRGAGSIKATFAKRAEALAPFAVDLHQVHFPLSFATVEAEMNAMADLVEAGKIRAVGVSNFSSSQMERAHRALEKRGLKLATNQVKYSLLDRRIEANGILAKAKQLGITIIAYSPLEMGLLSGKFHQDPELLNKRPFVRRWRLKRLVQKSRGLIDTLERIASERGVTASQVALNWLIHFHGPTVVAIPGATKPGHAVESSGAMNFLLSPEEGDLIAQTSAQLGRTADD